MHHLKEQLASCRQEGQPMVDYYGRLSRMWEELDMYKPLPACTCFALSDFEMDRKEEKVHQFVMGLDESRFGGICTGIIGSDTQLDLGEIYAKVIREEQRLNYAKDRESQQNAVGFVVRRESGFDQHSSRSEARGSGKRRRPN